MIRCGVLAALLGTGWVIAALAELPRIHADPDLVALSAEFHGTPQMKAGDRFSIGPVTIGGFIEVRNEARFNQGLFPNHNWRGFISGLCLWPAIDYMQGSLHLFSGLEHESAHATMGIVENTDDPYAMIYDHQYRKYILNALPAGAQLVMFDAAQQLVIRVNGAWYFGSKNTPELPGLGTSYSGGFALGGEYRRTIARYLSLFISLHDRFIFTGSGTIEGRVYVGGTSGPVQQLKEYPVINRSNTFSATTGVSLPLFKARRQLEMYLRYLYGNCYGYVDSREKRSMVAVGLSIRGPLSQ